MRYLLLLILASVAGGGLIAFGATLGWGAGWLAGWRRAARSPRSNLQCSSCGHIEQPPADAPRAVRLR